MSDLRGGNVLACEYIAQGAHGKLNLVNVYTGDIVVPSFPAGFPLAFYLELYGDFSRKRDCRIAVYIGNDLVAEVGLEMHAPDAPDRVAVIPSPQIAMNFREPTSIRVEAALDGEQPITLLTKAVFAGQIPGA